MGRPSGKKKKSSGGKLSESNSKNSRCSDNSPKVFDQDATMFIDTANDMKEEGNRLFQRRDYEGALVKYEKAIKLLPKDHDDVAYLHSNMAACYMQKGPEEYDLAINECNLALEASPRYTKALLKRARCFEGLNRLELASRDADTVLSLEPNNQTALEISERIKEELEENGVDLDDKDIIPLAEPIITKEKTKKKKNHKDEEKMVIEEKPKEVKKEPSRIFKFVFGEDIRCAQVPSNCSILEIKGIVRSKFPNLKAFLIKYKDREGDLVTITTSEELKWASESVQPPGTVRLNVTEVNPEHEPFIEEVKDTSSLRGIQTNHLSISDNRVFKYEEERSSATYVDDWIVQFAQLFKNHVGFESDSYLNLHDLGMKLYFEAMEEIATGEGTQKIFELAEEMFQEMTALALFNGGNVHMSRARKSLSLSEDSSRECMLSQAKEAYEWARDEYVKAGQKYEEAIKFKPDFYEGIFALGKQQFEQAKLSWYFAIGNKADFETWPSAEIIELFNNAEDNLEKGTEMWEELEKKRIRGLYKSNDQKTLRKAASDSYVKEIPIDGAAELASTMRAQINILWGTILYERSVVEFKLDLPTWEECLMASIEKFKVAGAPSSDLAVMMKNHCGDETAQEGLGFKITEIVQAWYEMYDAKRWINGASSFRLEPLLQRKVPKLHHMLEYL